MKRPLLSILVPAIALLVAAAAILSSNIFDKDRGAPPVERLTVERVLLDGDGIAAIVRAEGSAPVSIAQIQVDGAYWSFKQVPPGPIGRLSAVKIQIPYPWVAGETHKLLFITSTGVTYDHTIDVAVATPEATTQPVGEFILLGIVVGLLPVVIGMLAFPALRSGGAHTFTFALALTMGLLTFLFIDTLSEALEQAAQATPGFNANTMVWVVMVATFAALLAIGRGRGLMPTGTAVAFFIAFGIGLHNFGEGLAIGTAYATGAAVLGSFLVLGFTLHNVTEGIGIVAPLLHGQPNFRQFAGLAFLAGLPTVPGVLLGASLFASHWAALALAIGAGAILQVIAEIGSMMLRDFRKTRSETSAMPALIGLISGVIIMYGTGLLVQTF